MLSEVEVEEEGDSELGGDDNVSYSTGANEDNESTKSTEDNSPSEEESSEPERSSEVDEDSDNPSEREKVHGSKRTSYSSNQSTDSRSSGSRTSESQVLYEHGTPKSFQSHDNEEEPGSHSGDVNYSPLRKETSRGITNSLHSFEGDSGSADYTSGSDSTYDDSSGRSSSVANDDSSRSFSTSWSKTMSNTFANDDFAWPSPGNAPRSSAGTFREKKSNSFSSLPGSTWTRHDAEDVERFATTPIRDKKVAYPSNRESDGFNPFPPNNLLEGGGETEKRLSTVEFDLNAKKSDAGSVSTSKPSSHSTAKEPAHQQVEDWFGSAASVGSSKHSTRKSMSTQSASSRSNVSSRPATDPGKQRRGHSSTASSNRSSDSDLDFRLTDPSGVPPSRGISYKVASNYASQSGSEVEDSIFDSGSECKQDPNDAFGFKTFTEFPGSTSSAFSTSSNVQSNSRDIDGFDSFRDTTGDEIVGFKISSQISLTNDFKEDKGSKSKDMTSGTSSLSKSASSRRMAAMCISQKTSAQSQTSFFSSGTAQGSKLSRQSPPISNNNTSSQKGPRMSISELLPPKSIGNLQSSLASGFASKDTLSRTPKGDEPSISLSDVFTQSPPQVPHSSPSESSRTRQQQSISTRPTDSASSVPSQISQSSETSFREGPTGSCSAIDRDNFPAGSASTFGSFNPDSKNSPGRNDPSDVDTFCDILASTKLSSSTYAVPKDPTMFNSGTFGTALTSVNKRPSEVPGNTFGTSVSFDNSVQSIFSSRDEKLQSECPEVSSMPPRKVKQELSSIQTRDVETSFASSSGSSQECTELSDNIVPSRLSSNQSKVVDDFPSNPGLNSRSPSFVSETGTYNSLSERTSLSVHTSGKGASRHGSPWRGSRSEKSSISKSSRTVSKSSRSSSSAVGGASRNSFSRSTRSNHSYTSSDGSRNLGRNSGSISKTRSVSGRPQNAGDSSREGSSHESGSFSSRSGALSFRDTCRRSSNMSSRSGSVSVATCSSRSVRSKSERSTKSTSSLNRARSQSHRLKSCSLPSSTQERSTSRRRDHQNHKERNNVVSRMVPNQLPDIFFFGKSVSLLKEIDVGLKMELRIVHATVNSGEFMSMVSLAYQKLCTVRPRLPFLLSGAEWMHIHCLLLYARLFDCELHFHKITLPKEFQIGIPADIYIFEPIAAVLASIGIVEDQQSGVTYVPVAKPYRGDVDYKPHDPEDVTEFLEWTHKDGLGYDWNASWEQVEVGRQSRKQMALEQGIKIPIAQSKIDPEKEEEKLKDWNLLAVEKWLGWDDDLWSSYKQACHVLSRIADFSPYTRNVKTGTYAWLLPREENDTGTTVRLPSTTLSADTWMIALLCNFCALPQQRTSTWYKESNTWTDVQNVTSRFLEVAIRTKTNDMSIPNGDVLETVQED